MALSEAGFPDVAAAIAACTDCDRGCSTTAPGIKVDRPDPTWPAEAKAAFDKAWTLAQNAGAK